MGKHLIHASMAVAALAAACGARTGLLVDERDEGSVGTTPSAAPTLDASVREPSIFDLPEEVPPDCDGGDVTMNVLVAPTVILLIDQSGSMQEPFSGRTRWVALRDSLVKKPDGLVPRFQRSVRFGLALYSARSANGGSGGPPIGECPLLTTVAPSLDNLDAITDEYIQAQPLEDTPTGDAIDAVVDGLGALPPQIGDPSIIVLATDGEPDECRQLDPQNGQAHAVGAAERAFSAGIRTFVISVGRNVVSGSHLQDMANAGLGVADDAPFWEAGDDKGLRSALLEIIRNEISCGLLLDGRIHPESACDGSLLLDGMPLPCDDKDGWRAVDARQIEVLGDACTRLESSREPVVEAIFPCDVVAAVPPP